MTGFVPWLLRRPARSALLFIAGYAALWWLVPHLAQRNLPLDVIEQIAWAREPQWVYHKHPPLPAWLLALVDRLSGGSPAAIQLLSPLALALGFWCLWRLADALLSPPRALLALLLLAGVGYFGLQAAEFNHNIVQVPLWGLTALCCWRALAADRWGDWLAFGAAAAMTLYGKYYAGFLLLALALFLLREPQARRRLRRPGPWLALAAFIAVLAPHLVALVRLDFLPLDYALARTAPAADLLERLWFPLRFALAQAVSLAGCLLALLLLFTGGKGEAALPAEAPTPLARRFAATLAFGPFALTLLASLLLGADFRDVWGMPLWLFLPLALLTLWPRRLARPAVARALAVTAATAVGGLLFYLGYLVYPALLGEVARVHYPGPQLAEAAAARWRQAAGERPLAFVMGDVWEAGNVAFYGPWDSLVVIDGDLATSRWVAPAALRQAGGLVVWQGEGDGAPAWVEPLRRSAGLGAYRFLGAVALPLQGAGADTPSLGFRFGLIEPLPP